MRKILLMQSKRSITDFWRSKNFQSYEIFQVHAKDTDIVIDQIKTWLQKTLDFIINPQR